MCAATSDLQAPSTLPVRRRTQRPHTGEEGAHAPEIAVIPAKPWEDARNVVIIVAAWLLLLGFLPAARDYPSLDDWIYIPTARDTYETGVFVMPSWSQANLAGLIYWGVFWCKLFGGFSITALTYSSLFLYLWGMLAFYGIGRLSNLTPGASLFATALLGFNPIVLYLVYIFQTDVPFISLMLMACYCYMRGLRMEGGAGIAWLIAGGLFTGWNYLMRQFAILIPVGFVAYLLLEGILMRSAERGTRNTPPPDQSALRTPHSPLKRWRWGHILVAVIVPLAFVAGWAYWTRYWPQTWALSSATGRAQAFIMQPAWPRVSWVRHIIYLPYLAFSAWAAVKLPRSRRWLVPAMLLALVWSMYNLTLEPEASAQQVEPPFIAQIGPLSFPLPQQTFTFGLLGSLFRLNGIDFEEFYYPQEKVWTPEAWRAIWVVGVVLGALLMAKMASGFLYWLRSLWRTKGAALSPLTAFYVTGLAIAIASIAFPGDTYPRYVLGYVPFAIIFVLRGAKEWGRLAWGYSIAALVVLATFSLLARADYAEHMRVRYDAALWMEARTGEVRAGWNWNKWGHPDSQIYVVSDLPEPGFRVEKSLPYTCRLCGFTTRYVLAQARADLPPTRVYPLPARPLPVIGPPPRR